MKKYTGLIAGVTGAIGSALARELAQRPEWSVFGVSRYSPASPISNVKYVSIDLSDEAISSPALSELTDVTHIFYCGRVTHAEQVIESSEDNLSLLDNLVTGVETSTTTLEHVHLVQGGKYYGVHVGPFPTPAGEEDHRAPIQNFNYTQQDYLVERSNNAQWSWSASRPNTLMHYSPNIARNLVSSLGAYAAICRELGCAFDFPGVHGAFDSLTQLTSIELLARGITWAATEEKCQNQGFNFTNTDVIRWSSLWPKIAKVFDMPCGSIRPLRLDTVMVEQTDVWESIANKHKLQYSNIKDVANWGYIDATLERYWDEIFSHNKTRELGFHDWDNSCERFLNILKQYQNTSILPN